ncbi:MAG: HAMP domain-containing protein [Spirochaetales bacterium]|nr:HAMP domain-containing protein [Spirochaetales bacterium]MBR6199919.1 HAMP domain-containing protein [Spirochaetales bacterium]
MKKFNIKAFIKNNLPLFVSLVFWLLLSIILVGFVSEVFRTSDESFLQREKIMLVFFIVLSGVLFVFITLYLIRLLVRYIRRTFGEMLKFKITIFFIFVIMLSMLPTLFIGVRFIQASMNVWFSDNIGRAFDLSQELITSYYAEKKHDLFDEFDRIDEYLSPQNVTADRLASMTDIILSHTGADCIAILTKDSHLVSLSGVPLWVMPFAQDGYTLPQSRFIMISNDDDITMLRHKANHRLYHILPVKIIDQNGDIIGFINIAKEIHFAFANAMTEIDQSLRSWTTVSMYRRFFMFGFIILFLALLFPIILVVLLIAIVLSNQLLKPVADLSDATKQIADGNYQIIDTSQYTDEYVVLSESFNAMTREIELSRKKISQNEKILAWKDIARRFAHEIRNPLSSVRLGIERLILKHDKHAADFDEVFDRGANAIIREVERMDKQLGDFSSLAKTDGQIELAAGGIKDILNDSAELFALNKNNVTVRIAPNIADLRVLRDPNLLKSVFNNLIINAIEASLPGQEILINMTQVDIGFTSYARISVQDWGCGVKTQVAGVANPDIFEPYWTTKADGQGLGLAMCQRIVHQHNGRIYYQSSEDETNHGTTFFVEIPLL